MKSVLSIFHGSNVSDIIGKMTRADPVAIVLKYVSKNVSSPIDTCTPIDRRLFENELNELFDDTISEKRGTPKSDKFPILEGSISDEDNGQTWKTISQTNADELYARDTVDRVTRS